MREFNHKVGVTLLGAGAECKDSLTLALERCPDLYCADGGANKAGRPPLAVIGDLDSVDKDLPHLRDCIFVELADQNSTDFEKCLGAITAPYILCVGFLGGRLDHQWAAFSALIKHPKQRAILLGSGELCFRAPASFTMSCKAGMPIGLYPLTPARAKSKGLNWSLDGLDLRPDGRLGTSNRASASHLSLEVQSGDILVSLPIEFLDSVIEGLLATD